jgi:hypothetical protein
MAHFIFSSPCVRVWIWYLAKYLEKENGRERRRNKIKRLGWGGDDKHTASGLGKMASLRSFMA